MSNVLEWRRNVNEEIPSPFSLGRVEVSDKTFPNDVVISDRYQTFSAELLRLSLLGITGIGFLVVNIFLKCESRQIVNDGSFIGFLSASLFFLGLSAAGALFHRWASTDSIAEQLSLIRLEIRNAHGDAKRLEVSKRSETDSSNALRSRCYGQAYFSGWDRYAWPFLLFLESFINGTG